MNKKVLVFTGLMVFLFSCSLQEDQNDKYGDVSTLAVQGGGYLSTTNANEITPFIFRDTSSGKATLFFASDRTAGVYGIYYSAINNDETFQSPVYMSTVNSPLTNITSPFVFRHEDGAVYMAAIGVNGGNTNIITWKLNADFTVNSFLTNFAFNAHSLNLFQAVNYIGMLVCDGTSNIYPFHFNTNNIWQQDSTIIITNSVDSVSGYTVVNFIKYSGNSFYLLGLASNRFSAVEFLATFNYSNDTFYTNNSSLRTNYMSAGIFSSTNNDQYPFVDVKIGMRNSKVYFASKRGANPGNYDLYRYNVHTFESELKTEQ